MDSIMKSLFLLYFLISALELSLCEKEYLIPAKHFDYANEKDNDPASWLKPRDHQHPFRMGHTKYPYNIAIDQVMNDESYFICGGLLFHPQLVLTSASCFENKVAEKLRIRDNDGRNKKVKSIIRHPDYLEGSYYHDIAILKLLHPLPINVILDSDSKIVNGSVIAKSHALVTDWAIDLDANPKLIAEMVKEYQRMPVLREGTLISADECEKYYRSYCRNHEINFDSHFPQGIADANLICVLVDHPKSCMEYGGFQLLLATSMRLFVPQLDSPSRTIAQGYAQNLDISDLTINTYDPDDVLMVGTRAQLNKELAGRSICSTKLWKVWNLPIIYTHTVRYTDWIESVIDEMENY